MHFQPIVSISTATASSRTAKAELPQSNPPFLTTPPSLTSGLNLVPVDSYIPNRPFSDPGQAATIGGNVSKHPSWWAAGGPDVAACPVCLPAGI